MDSAVELQLRSLIFEQLSSLVSEYGAITRKQLESLKVGNQTRRIIDRSKGIWNPSDLLGTLSIVSSPDGGYADTFLGESLMAYDYQRDSTDGDNIKMRMAHELGLPMILLRKIKKDGVYVP